MENYGGVHQVSEVILLLTVARIISGTHFLPHNTQGLFKKEKVLDQTCSRNAFDGTDQTYTSFILVKGASR